MISRFLRRDLSGNSNKSSSSQLRRKSFKIHIGNLIYIAVKITSIVAVSQILLKGWININKWLPGLNIEFVPRYGIDSNTESSVESKCKYWSGTLCVACDSSSQLRNDATDCNETVWKPLSLFSSNTIIIFLIKIGYCGLEEHYLNLYVHCLKMT